jgi:hypothetical protein
VLRVNTITGNSGRGPMVLAPVSRAQDHRATATTTGGTTSTATGGPTMTM